ncbi:hypothetical protein E2C01_001987 [Portunus trituberculatus]|uniref:Uncharacterized protein n=1 Tax=Portunus trituberculatus TaxID=210409 RepID=A0A5B7CIL1_PORTR|nr:hypothetical protein [Portunus trituberculatus]
MVDKRSKDKKREKEKERDKEKDSNQNAEPANKEPQDVEMQEEGEEEEEEGGIRIGDIYLPPPPPPACTFDSTEPRLIITHIENEFFKRKKLAKGNIKQENIHLVASSRAGLRES